MSWQILLRIVAVVLFAVLAVLESVGEGATATAVVRDLAFAFAFGSFLP